MTAAELLSTLEARGVRLQSRGDALDYDAPPETLAPADFEALRALKADVLAALRGRALGEDWTRVSLWQVDRVLELAVPWANVPLLLVPACRLARELRDSDSKPGRVWCVCEVLDLLLANVPPEQARTTADVKLVFGGIVAGVRREHGS